MDQYGKVWFTVENEHGEVFLGEDGNIQSYIDARIAALNLLDQGEEEQAYRIVRHSRQWYDTIDANSTRTKG